MPNQTNPAEWILEIVDTDFAKNKVEGIEKLKGITAAWAAREQLVDGPVKMGLTITTPARRAAFMQPVHLLHRNWIKSYRDLIAYWIRVGMYICEFLVSAQWLTHRSRTADGYHLVETGIHGL